MNLSTFSTIIAAAATLGAAATIAALVVLCSPQLSKLRAKLQRYALASAAVVAVLAAVSSLLLSDYYDLPPCKLCWYQRIGMYPLAAILPIAAWRRDATIRFYALPVALCALAVAVFHALVERLPSLQGAGSCEIANPCSIVWFTKFGYFTIPVGAGICLAFISVCLILARPSRTA